LYLPSDDSILLANCIKGYHGNLALDIGVGSGIITKTLCKNFKYVAGSDIVIETLKSCKESVASDRQSNNNEISKRDMGFELICTDAASAFRSSVFDLIVSNPPYLPDDYDNEGKKIHDRTIYGGRSGIELTLHIIRSSLSALRRDGRLVIIVSSLSDVSRLYQLTHQLNLSIKKMAQKKMFFETVSVIEIRF
jgi:release factor glutamine methyltransferase